MIIKKITTYLFLNTALPNISRTVPMCNQYKKKVNNNHLPLFARRTLLVESPETQHLQSQSKLWSVHIVVMSVIWAAILVIAATSKAAPAVRYDQRQEGDVNVRADLENFVVLIIPTSGSSPSSGGAGSSQGTSLGLLDLLSKAVPSKGHPKQQKHESKKVHHTPVDTAQFMESKTAPYHVDISRSRNQLSKLHQDQQKEVVIAESPAVNVAKAHDILRLSKNADYGRRSKTVSIEVPSENLHGNTVKAIVVSPEDIAVGRVKLQVARETPQKTEPQEALMLIGAPLEQCGPGQKRDGSGICQSATS